MPKPELTEKAWIKDAKRAKVEDADAVAKVIEAFEELTSSKRRMSVSAAEHRENIADSLMEIAETIERLLQQDANKSKKAAGLLSDYQMAALKRAKELKRTATKVLSLAEVFEICKKNKDSKYRTAFEDAINGAASETDLLFLENVLRNAKDGGELRQLVEGYSFSGDSAEVAAVQASLADLDDKAVTVDHLSPLIESIVARYPAKHQFMQNVALLADPI